LGDEQEIESGDRSQGGKPSRFSLGSEKRTKKNREKDGGQKNAILGLQKENEKGNSKGFSRTGGKHSKTPGGGGSIKRIIIMTKGKGKKA